MRAAVSTRYGPPDVVEVRQVPKPDPKAGEVLIKVHATTVSRTDCGMRRPHPFFVRFVAGLFRPKLTILGMDFAGEIEAVGAGVTSFKPGDHVFGLSPDVYGAHAEYLCVPEQGPIAAMPAAADFGQAVVCEGAWYADTYLRAFRLKPSHSILIYGASGAIGTAAVQLAKSYGAKVTAVVATRHLHLVRSLGADRAVDYTAQDFTQISETFDFVFDAVGKTTYFRCRRLLKPAGVFAATDLGPWGQNLLLVIWSSITGSHRVIFPLPRSSQANTMAESFFATLECELIDRRSWPTKTEARLALFTCIEGWYNPRRRHSALGQVSPANFEKNQTSSKRPQPSSAKHDLTTVGVCVACATPPVDKSAQELCRLATRLETQVQTRPRDGVKSKQLPQNDSSAQR